MPKVIIGDYQRNVADSEKLYRAAEKKIGIELREAKREKGYTIPYICEKTALTAPTVSGILNRPLSAKPKNLFLVMALLDVSV